MILVLFFNLVVNDYLCNMEWKKTRVYSILNNRCPVCLEADVLKYKNAFHPSKFDKMHERCSNCNHKFEREPGFFYGAMYVGYAISVAFSVAIFCTTYLLFPDTPYWIYIILILGGLILLAPITYRGGRLIWLNIFNGYKPKEIPNEQV